MKRFVPLIVIVVLFALLGLSCYPAGQQSQEPSESSLSSRMSSLESRLATAEGTIAQLQGRSSVDAYPKTETYTRTEIDTKIQSAKDYTYPRTDLYTRAEMYTKTEVDSKISSGSSGSSSGSSSTPPATNQITAKVYSLNPSMIYAAGVYDVFVEIKNGYADAKKIVLAITLTPDNSSTRICSSCSLAGSAVCCGGTSPCPSCLPTRFWSDSAYITGSGDKMATSVSAGDCVNYTSLIMGTTNQILISGNGSILVPVKFQLTYCGGSTTAIWSPVCSVTIVP